MDMWRGGYFSEHVLLWAESPPFFSGAKKNKKMTMAPMGTLCFVKLNLRNPLMETGEIIEDICRQGVLTNAYLLFGGTLPNFHRGKKKTILGNIFDKGHNWWLIIPQLEGM